jgi:cytochrome c oxidase subunit 3
MTDDAIGKPGPLPFGGVSAKGVGLWGIWTLIATEGSLFACLLFAYAFTAVQQGRGWFPAELPALGLAGPNTAILLASSAAVWWGEKGLKAGKPRRLTLGLLIAIALGCVFVDVQLMEWKQKAATPLTNGYHSFFFIVTGFHMAHVVVGLMGLSAVLLWNLLGYFDARRNTPVAVCSLYWHFVDVVWLFVFTAFYLAPYLA